MKRELSSSYYADILCAVFSVRKIINHGQFHLTPHLFYNIIFSEVNIPTQNKMDFQVEITYINAVNTFQILLALHDFKLRSSAVNT